MQSLSYKHMNNMLVGDNCSYKMCKALVKLSPLTNQHPTVLQAVCPSCRPCQSTTGKKWYCHIFPSITFHGPAHPKTRRYTAYVDVW